jgi:hypothetical protein
MVAAVPPGPTQAFIVSGEWERAAGDSVLSIHGDPPGTLCERTQKILRPAT